MIGSTACGVHTTVAEHDPLKQGLKLGDFCTIGIFYLVAEHDPLKQGLKPYLSVFPALRFVCCRARSIKTRIETCGSGIPQHPRRRVAEHDPLKQGLKLGVHISDGNLWSKVAEHDPLKQGLKHNKLATVAAVHRVAEHDPLKQGLKHRKHDLPILLLYVAEHDPLKQGLIATAVEATNY